MSEYSSITLVLGIVGTITGIIALFISFWTARKENPRLRGKVLTCEHWYPVSEKNVKMISVFPTLEIRNIGDRGTTINDVDLSFWNSGKKYQFRKLYFRGEQAQSQRRWIEAHQLVVLEPDFSEAFDGTEEKQIECQFRVFHTHGAIKAEGKSESKQTKLIFHVNKPI
jgi:hypothetical protein